MATTPPGRKQRVASRKKAAASGMWCRTSVMTIARRSPDENRASAPAAIKELGYDPSAMLDWFSEREFRMYALGKNGELIPGLSDELAAKGYVDLVFSRTPLV